MAVSQTFEQAIDALTRGTLERAEILCRQVLQEEECHAEALHLLGVVLGKANRLEEAASVLAKSVRIDPDNAYSRSDLGSLLRALGRAQEALVHLERSIQLQPENAAAFNDRGLALHSLKRYAEAVESYKNATGLAPDFAEAHFNLGMALVEMRRFAAALESFDRVIALDHCHADAHLQRGNVLIDLGRQVDALDAYEGALSVKADFVEAHNNRGAVLLAMKHPQQALESFDRAIGIRADFDEALNNRGSALRELGRLAEALQSYESAIAVRPGNAHAHSNRGAVLYSLERFAESVASCDKAIALMPGLAEAHNNRGLALVRRKRYADAVLSFRQAMALDAQIELLLGNLLMAQMHLCDWEDFDVRLADLEQRIRRGENATPPYAVLAMSSSPELQRMAAANHTGRSFPLDPALGAISKHDWGSKIRIGYFSADFRAHAVSFLIADLLEVHDRARFEFVGLYFGPDVHDDMRRRVSTSFDRFIDVRERSERGIARLSRELQIDIAVDLMGFTEHSRPGVFALRAAPIQVNYLGYPGTMGADYIDYIIADRTLITAESRPHFSEKVVYLPHSFQPNDRWRTIPERRFARGELGLPSAGRVFCCFHNGYKITRPTFEGWMRILKRVPGSVLWLREDIAEVTANLRRAAERNGVDGNRLVFAPRVAFGDHLARHSQADLFLDAFPFNAHTTASDALWAGLPVLTRAGDSYISRVGASLLSAVGLPELITRSQHDFEALAVELAGDPDRLAQIRQKLAQNRKSSPLFDTPSYAKHLEAAYTEMVERYRAGLLPADIEVAP